MVEIDLLENKDSLLRRIGKRLPTSADMLESPDEFLVLINVPGCDGEEIDLRFVRGNLKVRAEREEEHEGYTFVSEGRPKRISERVPIPAEVNVDEAEARYENGVLRVRLPKAPGAKGLAEEEETEAVDEEEFHDVGVTEPGETKEEAVEEVVGEAEESEEDEEEEGDFPSSREELEDMSYRDLQGVAKELDIKANQSTEDLVEEISDELDL